MMLYQAKNFTLSLKNGQMDGISFGRGQKNLLILPGLGDGIRTVKGSALPFAFSYRCFAQEYRVYVLSRKEPLPQSCTIREMAADVLEAMDALAISKVKVLGVSMGGMIAQQLALLAPERIEKLILAVTACRNNETLNSVVKRWMALVESGSFQELMIDTIEHSYTEAYLKKYRRLYPLLSLLGKPKSFCRFLTMAEACLHHNTEDQLEQIHIPTLVIGAAEDKIMGSQASLEIAARLPCRQLFLYDGFGHGVYEEAKDFNQRVMDFLQ